MDHQRVSSHSLPVSIINPGLSLTDSYRKFREPVTLRARTETGLGSDLERPPLEDERVVLGWSILGLQAASMRSVGPAG